MTRPDREMACHAPEPEPKWPWPQCVLLAIALSLGLWVIGAATWKWVLW